MAFNYEKMEQKSNHQELARKLSMIIAEKANEI